MIYAVNGATYGDVEKAAESFMGLREEEKEMIVWECLRYHGISGDLDTLVMALMESSTYVLMTLKDMERFVKGHGISIGSIDLGVYVRD